MNYFTYWSYTVAAQIDILPDRGFTGHEYLPWFKLYNMNGRLYDPVVGRFLAPDPIVQDASSTQNLNRYSYCLNNPLKYTDPSGYYRRLEPGPGEERWIDPYYHSPGGGWGPIGPGSGNYWSDAFAYSTNNFHMFSRSYLGLPLDAKMNTVTYGMRNGQMGFWFDKVEVSSQKRVGEAGSDDFRATFDVTYTHAFVANLSAGSDWEGTALDHTGKTLGGFGLLTKGRELVEWEYLRQAKFNRALSGNFSQPIKTSLRALKNTGRTLGYAGVALSGVDMAVNGINVSNSLDLVMGGVAFIPGFGWAVSGLYFVGNIGWQAYSGRTIGESIQSNFTDPNDSYKPW